MQASPNERSPEHWRLTTDAEGLAYLTIDKAGASVNSLSRAVMEELDALLSRLERERRRRRIVRRVFPVERFAVVDSDGRRQDDAVA